MERKKTIAVVMGGNSAEYEISLETGKEVARYLDKNKYEVLPIHISQENVWQAGEGSVEEVWRAGDSTRGIREILDKTDVVFNATHGQFGEDGRLQGFLDFLRVPYTGSGLAASALAFDKMRSRDLFKFNGISVPETVVFERDQANSELASRHTVETLSSPPWVVKPVRAGSSVGVSIVRDQENFHDALHSALWYDDEILVEEYIGGREFTCGVLENFNGERHFALPVVEIIPPEQYEFFDYEAKYNPETQEIVPADIPDILEKEIQNIALLAHKVLGCKLYSRSDMIVRDEKIYLLETNTLPGLTGNSLYPKEAKAAGLSFPELLDKFIEETIRRR